MLTCNCTLPINNPDACKSCSRWKEYQNLNSLKDISGTGDWYPILPNIPWSQPETKKVKKITRTIEKYDQDGKFIGKEIITEEVEDIQIWKSPTIYVDGTGTINTSNSLNPNGKITNIAYDPDVPYSYTTNYQCCSN